MYNSYMTPVIEAIADGFMRARDEWAPSHTIRREILDGLVSATVIDRGTNFILAEMRLPPAQREATKVVVTQLMKLLYSLETKRFERGGHTDGHDVLDAFKDRLIGYCTSETMKMAANHQHYLSAWRQSEAREASKRLAEAMFDNYGQPHGIPRASRW